MAVGIWCRVGCVMDIAEAEPVGRGGVVVSAANARVAWTYMCFALCMAMLASWDVVFLRALCVAGVAAARTPPYPAAYSDSRMAPG